MAKSFLFGPGSFTQPSGQTGLSLTFSRPFATTDLNGSPLANGTGASLMRGWNHKRLLCGAPDATVVSTFVSGGVTDQPTNGSFFQFYAGGVATNGSTPLLLHFNGNNKYLIIHKEFFDQSHLTSAHRVYVAQILGTTGRKGPQAGNPDPNEREAQVDLLVGQSNEEDDFCFFPKAFAICHGLAVAVCSVLRDTTPLGIYPTWREFTTALCYWQEGVSSGEWVLMGLDTNTAYQADNARGAHFQLQGYRIFQTDSYGNALDVWFVFADYVNNNPSVALSEGGNFYVVRFKRTSTSAAWVLDTSGNLTPTHYLPEPPPAGTSVSGQHAHTAYLERWDDDGLRLVCPVGDSYPHNRVNALYVADEDDHDTPANWSPQLYQHGEPAGSGVPPGTPLRDGNQFVGAAPIGTPDDSWGQLVGGDETPCAIMRAFPPSEEEGTATDFYNAFFQSVCSWNRGNSANPNYAFNVFYINNANPIEGGPFFAQMAPGSQQFSQFDSTTKWTEINPVSRMLYSPDGLIWGQYWCPMEASSIPHCIFGGYVNSPLYIGRSQMRKLNPPTHTAQAPMYIGGRGNNALASSVAAPACSTIGANNTTVKVSVSGGVPVLPTGVPLPPCVGANIFRCTVGSTADTGSPTTNTKVGVWKLTDSSAISATSGPPKMKLRMWLWPLSQESGADNLPSSLYLDVSVGKHSLTIGGVPTVETSRERFRQLGPIPTVGYAGSSPVPQSANWNPVTLDTDSNDWVADAGGGAVPTANFDLGLRIASREFGSTLPPNPCDFLVAFEYVLQDYTSVEHPGIALPLATSVPDTQADGETCIVSGFSCGSAWTFAIAGETPPDSWDSTDRFRKGGDSTPDAVLFTLANSNNSRWVKVRFVKYNGSSKWLDAIRFEWWDSTTATLRDGRNLELFLLRNSPVLISLSQNGEITQVAVSVGGSEVATAYLETSEGWSPDRLVFGEWDSTNNKSINLCPMLWYGAKMQESTAKNTSQMTSDLKELEMLYDREVVTRPG